MRKTMLYAALPRIFVVFLAGFACSCAHEGMGDLGARDASHFGAASMGHYHALIIGNGDYQDPHWERLEAATKDALELKRVLEQDYGYLVHLLPNATYDQMMDELATLENSLAESDRLLIYFSGHGDRRGPRRGGFWLPVDAKSLSDAERRDATEPPEPDAHWISRDDIVQVLKRIPSAHIMVVDDSCFSGTIKNADEEVLVSPGQVGPQNPSGGGLPSNDANKKSDPPSSKAHPNPQMPTQVRSANAAEDFSRKLLSKRVRIWLSASGAEEAAWASETSPFSLFTEHFIRVLEENDGVMDGNELFGTIRKRMASAPEPQVPEYNPIMKAEHAGGDFLFVRKTWSVDEMELDIGKVVVRITERARPYRNDTNEKDQKIKLLVLGQLKDTNDRSRGIRPADRPRHLFLAVSYSKENELVMTLIDRDTDQIIGKVTQALSADPEELGANVRSAVMTLRNKGEEELRGKEVSVDIVKRALVAQRRHDWELYGIGGVSAYVNLDGEGWLNEPAFSTRIGASRNLAPWFLLGVTVGLDTTKAESSHISFIGDVDSGTYANNKMIGKLTLHTVSAMIRATIRRSHGLVLPFGYAAAGICYHDLNLGDEHMVGATPSDTLPLNVINRREDTSDWAFALEAGAGLNFLLSENVSLVGQGYLFRTFDDMKVRSHIEGLNQTKQVVTDFQSIQGVSLQAGVALLL